MQEPWVWSLGWDDPLEKGMATHSSILVWRIPCTEEPGGLQSMGSQRVGHDWATFTFQWLGCQAFTAVGPGSVLVWGTKTLQPAQSEKIKRKKTSTPLHLVNDEAPKKLWVFLHSDSNTGLFHSDLFILNSRYKRTWHKQGDRTDLYREEREKSF